MASVNYPFSRLRLPVLAFLLENVKSPMLRIEITRSRNNIVKFLEHGAPLFSGNRPVVLYINNSSYKQVHHLDFL